MSLRLVALAALLSHAAAAVIGIDFGARFVKVGIIQPGKGIDLVLNEAPPRRHARAETRPHEMDPRSDSGPPCRTRAAAQLAAASSSLRSPPARPGAAQASKRKSSTAAGFNSADERVYADESFNLLGKLPQKQFVYSKIMLGKAPLRRWPVATRRHTAPHLQPRCPPPARHTARPVCRTCRTPTSSRSASSATRTSS